MISLPPCNNLDSPAAHLGIKEGDAHIIRNAGGVAYVLIHSAQGCRTYNGLICRKDALRSIIVSQQLLGTREIALFHHSDCGMLTFNNEDLQKSLKEKYPAVSDEIGAIDFYPFSDLEKSVKNDVKYLKEHPLVLEESVITGWIYDVKTGKVRENLLSFFLLGSDCFVRYRKLFSWVHIIKFPLI